MRTVAFAVVAVFAIALGVARATALRMGEDETRGTYQGVQYCADCPGIWTELTLEDPGPNIGVGRGTFVMTERYTGGIHKDETVVTTGTWSMSREADITSGLIQLRGSHAALPRYFRCQSGEMLFVAKADGIVDGDKAQFVLNRVFPTPPPLFSLTESQGNRTIYGRIGDRFSIRLFPTPAPGATPNPKPDFTAFKLIDVTQTPSEAAPLEVYGIDTIIDVIATNAGAARLTFRSRAKPTRLVSFDFEIRP